MMLFVEVTYLPHEAVINVGVEFFNFNNPPRVWPHLCALFDPTRTEYSELNSRDWGWRYSDLLRKGDKCHEKGVIFEAKLFIFGTVVA